MDLAAAALLVAVASVLWLLLLMERAEWLQDEHGRFAANGYHVGFLVLAAFGGAAAGGSRGAAAGFALVVATVNVPVTMLLAWGLSGGDGEADSPLAGVLATLVLPAGLAAFAVTVASGSDADAVDLLVACSPAVAVALALLVSSGPGRLRTGATACGLLVAPAVLLSLA